MLLAAMLDSRVVSPGRLRGFYDANHATFETELTHALMSGTRIAYNPGRSSGRPLPGDIVLFDGLDHVAAATGQLIQGPMLDSATATGARIVSFWPAPAMAEFGPKTRTKVAFTTIEAILAWFSVKMPGTTAPKVTFGSPNWALLNQ
jgi:hypothetical protein